MEPIEVWIEYASTQAYLSVSRIRALAAHRGVTLLLWRPMGLAAVREGQGMGLPFPARVQEDRKFKRPFSRHAGLWCAQFAPHSAGLAAGVDSTGSCGTTNAPCKRIRCSRRAPTQTVQWTAGASERPGAACKARPPPAAA